MNTGYSILASLILLNPIYFKLIIFSQISEQKADPSGVGFKHHRHLSAEGGNGGIGDKKYWFWKEGLVVGGGNNSMGSNAGEIEPNSTLTWPSIARVWGIAVR
jgi:hypothetical protein